MMRGRAAERRWKAFFSENRRVLHDVEDENSVHRPDCESALGSIAPEPDASSGDYLRSRRHVYLHADNERKWNAEASDAHRFSQIILISSFSSA